MHVTEDSDCDEMLLTRHSSSSMTRRDTPPVIDADDAARLTQECRAAVELEFSSVSACCRVESVKKASTQTCMIDSVD